jgi:hypothetical protein
MCRVRIVGRLLVIAALGLGACHSADLLRQDQEVLPAMLSRQTITLALYVPDGRMRGTARAPNGSGGQFVELILSPTGMVREITRRASPGNAMKIESDHAHKITPAERKQALALLARIAPDYDGEAVARGCSNRSDRSRVLAAVHFQPPRGRARDFLLWPDCRARTSREAMAVLRQATQLISASGYPNASLFRD